MPALLNATSSPPYWSTAAWNRASTWSGDVTSTWTNIPPTSAAAAAPLTGSTSPTTTCAPSAANRRAVARPMPLAPPVTTATRSTSRRTTACSLTTSPVRFRGTLRSSLAGARCDAHVPVRSRFPFGGQEHVLLVAEGVQRVGPELAAEAGLLEAAERRGVTHRRVAVDREVARLDAAGDAQGPAEVAGPDRPRQAVLALVCHADGVRLVLERDDRDDGPEDLLGHGPVLRVDGGEHRRREPEPGARGHSAAEGHRRAVRDVGRDPVPLGPADQR